MTIAFDADKVLKVEFAEDGWQVNVPEQELLAHMQVNLRRGLPQAMPYQPNLDTVVLVAGGPSLGIAEIEKDLIDAYWRGGKVICVNGSYDWCIARNIRPSAFVMLDGREFNARFVETPVPGCRYLLGSECHPSVFEICRDREVTIWHPVNAGQPALDMLDQFYFKRDHAFPVTLGSTVSLRAISLMRMFGYTRFDIFGLDSCYLDGEHHAYAQPENNSEPWAPVWLRPEGRDDLAQRFDCAIWHAKQFADFCELLKERGHMFQVNVRGPGLIATAMRIGLDVGGSVDVTLPEAAE